MYNSIDCWREQHCCAVGDGDDGAAITCTTDGGETWREVYRKDNIWQTEFVMSTIRFVSETEVQSCLTPLASLCFRAELSAYENGWSWVVLVEVCAHMCAVGLVCWPFFTSITVSCSHLVSWAIHQG